MLRGELTGAFLMVSLVLAVFLFLEWKFSEDSNEAPFRSYTLHRGDLMVVKTSLETVGKRQDIWLTGYVTNTGNRPWRVHELEVRALDARHKLIDVQSHNFSKQNAFVIEPGHEHAFRINLDTRANANTNVTLMVRVQQASDGRERYDPD